MASRVFHSKTLAECMNEAKKALLLHFLCVDKPKSFLEISKWGFLVHYLNNLCPHVVHSKGAFWHCFRKIFLPCKLHLKLEAWFDFVTQVCLAKTDQYLWAGAFL
jgi:hypothetical protein